MTTDLSPCFQRCIPLATCGCFLKGEDTEAVVLWMSVCVCVWTKLYGVRALRATDGRCRRRLRWRAQHRHAHAPYIPCCNTVFFFFLRVGAAARDGCTSESHTTHDRLIVSSRPSDFVFAPHPQSREHHCPPATHSRRHTQETHRDVSWPMLCYIITKHSIAVHASRDPQPICLLTVSFGLAHDTGCLFTAAAGDSTWPE